MIRPTLLPAAEDNEIRRHLFGATIDECEIAAFGTKEQLLEIPWVNQISKMAGFHRFSVSMDRLVAEFDKERDWLVVGFIKRPVEGLPVWTRPT